MAEADPADGPIVLFDGVCNLCTGTVRFIVPRDPEGTLRFASLQSDVGQALLERCGLPTDAFESFVVVEGETCYTRSSAALRIAKHLGGAYGLLYPLRHVPRRLRDALYDVVADHRYEWFGRRDACLVPGPELESRFVE